MKNNIIFALLVAVIAAAGIAGSELLFRSTSRTDTGEEAVRRSSFQTGSVYITDDAELFSEPMKLLDRNVWLTITDSSTDQDFIGDCPYSEMIILLLRSLSRYSEYTAIDSIINEPKIIRTSNDSEYCVKGLRYTNPAGVTMTADLIITSYLEVKYVRFYDDISRELTPDEIQLGADRLNSMTEQLFNDLKYVYETDDDGGYYIVSTPWDDIPYIEIELSDAENVADIIENALADVSSNTSYDSSTAADSTPIERFLHHTGSFSQINLTELDKDYPDSYDLWMSMTSTSMISDYITNSYEANPRYSSELVASDGRIYETLRISDNYHIINVVFIYNVEHDVIEGVYSSSDQTVW